MRLSGYQEIVKCVEYPQWRYYINKRSRIFKNVQKLYTTLRQAQGKIFKNCMEIFKNCIETFENIQRFCDWWMVIGNLDNGCWILDAWYSIGGVHHEDIHLRLRLRRTSSDAKKISATDGFGGLKAATKEKLDTDLHRLTLFLKNKTKRWKGNTTICK